jgi:hypothetical protein
MDAFSPTVPHNFMSTAWSELPHLPSGSVPRALPTVTMWMRGFQGIPAPGIAWKAGRARSRSNERKQLGSAGIIEIARQETTKPQWNDIRYSLDARIGCGVQRERAMKLKYNHVGIPTTGPFEGEIPVPHLKVTVSDHQNNPFGIQWQRYWDDAPYPELIKTVPHVAFEVDDLTEALRDQKVIVPPNSPSRGVLVAMIEVNGAPVELMQIDHLLRPDL